MKNAKRDYINLCESEPTIPIFMQNWWLDAVCTEGGDFQNSENPNWNVAVSRDKNGEITGALTFQIRKKWGFTMLNEPPLTPFCGVWLRQNDFKKPYEQYHFIKKTLAELNENLPKAALSKFRFHFSLTDWQPFFWKNWRQTTRYTYVLDIKNKHLELK